MISFLHIIRTSVAQIKFNPDAIDTEIYIWNSGKDPISFYLKNNSFLTLDTEGEVTSGPSETEILISIKPDQILKVGEIEGWEWDGHVGIEIILQDKKNSFLYDLKLTGKNITVGTISGKEIKPQKK